MLYQKPISINKLYRVLRKLAKTNKYQTLYNQSKEGCITLFRNIADYTDFQIAFLQYLSFYNSLNMDIFMEEVSEIVLENEVYEDAYQVYKNKTKKIKKKPNSQLPNKPKKSAKGTINPSNTHVVFSKPRLRK